MEPPKREEIMKKKSTIVPLTSSPIVVNPITDFMLALNPLGSSLGLLLLARDNHWTAVVVAFLVVFAMRSIAKGRTGSFQSEVLYS